MKSIGLVLAKANLFILRYSVNLRGNCINILYIRVSSAIWHTFESVIVERKILYFISSERTFFMYSYETSSKILHLYFFFLILERILEYIYFFSNKINTQCATSGQIEYLN